MIKKKMKNAVYLSIFITISLFIIAFIINDLKLLAIGSILIFLFLGLLYLENKPIIILLLMVLIQSKFISFLPNNINFGSVSIRTLKLNLILLIFLYFYLFKKILRQKLKYKFNFSLFLLSISLLLSIISAIYTNITINQSVLVGVFIQGEFLLILAIIPLYFILDRTYIEYKKIKKGIRVIALIASFIYIIQYLLSNKILFLSVMSSVRYGSTRLHLSWGILVIGIFISFSSFLTEKKKSYLFETFLMMGCIAFILKGRMILLGSICGILFMLAINKTIDKVKIIIGIVILAILTGPFLYKGVNEVLEFTQMEINSNKGNYAIRVNEEKFYKSQVTNYLVGRGVVTPKTQKGYLLDGAYKEFYISDIGVTGFYVCYGVLGVIWYVVVVLTLIIKSIKLVKRKGVGYEVGAFGIFNLTVCMTMSMNNYPILVLVIFVFVIILDNYNKVGREGENEYLIYKS